jgi:hypothetical protein
MQSREVQVGKKVRVEPGHGTTDLRGLVGTIERRYGSPDYAALEVRFGDGRSELFWHYEVEVAED